MAVIHVPDLTDTDYATLADKGCDPQLEYLIIKSGKPRKEARKLTRLVEPIGVEPSETDQKWDEFLSVWEDEG